HRDLHSSPTRRSSDLKAAALRPEAMLGPELTPPRRRVVLPTLCGVLQSQLRRLRRVALATHIAATTPRIRRTAMASLTPAAILVVAATAISARQAPRLPRNCATLRPAPHHLPALNAGNIGLTDHANLRASKSPAIEAGRNRCGHVSRQTGLCIYAPLGASVESCCEYFA